MKHNIEVVYEDNHLIAVNKPAGWLVQGDQTGDMPLSDYVKWYIKNRYNKPGDVFLGTIHRLDRPVSGVTVFARTSKALTRMSKLFQDRLIQKTYLALVEKRPAEPEGELIHYIEKDKERNVSKASYRKRSKNAKIGELTYELRSSIGQLHLLEVKPKTGRPHQIRVQLSHMGCPIRGDIKYGASKPNHDADICLHAQKLSFVHPVKREPIVITADPPARHQLWQIFKESIRS
ncbi:MAG: RluA family pseudouridine synthase [Saprospiraceae bacterium]|nr:RluA family pseudouridine synthase [Saprospiraceae bacterium]